jgi:Flp pilus assembly pilin Flp
MHVRAGRHAPGRRGRRGDRGAAAVEFALLAVPLFTLLFGAIAYGLYFADVQTIERATADAARGATLSAGTFGLNWTGPSACVPTANPLNGGEAGDLAKVVCGLSSSIKPLGGDVLYVKAEIVNTGGLQPDGWVSGNRLRVCSLTRDQAVLPFVPLPGGGVISTRVDMPIQQGAPVGSALIFLSPVAQSVSGIGMDWAWCDA